MVLLRILIFIVSISIGILILKYTKYIVDQIGYSEWAERYLKFFGGTYAFWKIIALLIIAAGVYFSIKGW